MTCQKCGGDIRRAFAGSVEVLRHVTAPKDPHYPRVQTPERSVDSLPLRRGVTKQLAVPAAAQPTPSAPELDPVTGLATG